MPEQLQSEKSVFLEAVEITCATERAAYLDRTCKDNLPLRDKVEALLRAHETPQRVLDAPEAVTPTIAEESFLERPGTVIGPYKLLQQIGEGGMGTVFMAEQTRPVQRKVALKVIKAGMDSRQVIARFEAERQALAMMDHVNIARVLDAGTTGERRDVSPPVDRRADAAPLAGRPYFVMELVHGVPITKYCDDNHLTPRERLELFVPVCQAIQHAHQKGIIHRDIKPSNVMVTLYDGKPVPKVIDFGVAKATEQKLTERTLFTQYGTMVGTLEYMSPEQAEMSALGVDTRSDIYSLGVLLYELLTGSTPLTHKRMKDAAYAEILRMIKEEEPPKPSTRLSDSGEALASISAQRKTEPAKLTKLVRGELDWIVMKCLEKDRNRRYESASAIAADVQRYLNDEPVQACPPSAWYRFRKFARRNKRAVVTAAAAALVVVLGVAGLAVSTVLIGRALQAETRAKDDLDKNLKQERQEGYYRGIALAYRELSADNLGRALILLGQCPDELRKWEWDLLMRLCRVEQVILQNEREVGVTSVAFSPDGERLAAAGADGTVKIWNRKTGKVIRTLEKAHAGFVSSVAFHPHGKHLASTGKDKRVKVWDLDSTNDLMVFDGPCEVIHTRGTAYAVAFSPQGPNHLAVGSGGTVTLWDWRNKKAVHTFPGHDKRGICVAFSRDGRRLATGDWQGTVKIWDVLAGVGPLCTASQIRDARHPVGALAFNDDGTSLATASFDRNVDVWDTATGTLRRSLSHSGRIVLGVAFSPDGRLIASTGEDKTVHVWEADRDQELFGLRGHTGLCGCVAFSPDGLHLASTSMDGTIRLWDATPLQRHERQEAHTLTQPQVEIWSLAVSADGQSIASAGFGRSAKIWDADSHQVIAEFDGYTEVVFCVAWHPLGKRLAFACSDGPQFTVKVWNAQTKEEEYALRDGPEEYTAAAFSPDGKYLVTGRTNRAVQVWDARDGRRIGTLGTHGGGIQGVVFSRDGRLLASAGQDGWVRLWDATRLGEKQPSIGETGPQKPLRAFPTHIPGACLNLAFSPDGKRIAIGAKEHTVVIWDVESGQELTTLRGHSGDVCTVAFSPDGRWVASAGEDSTVKVWDSHTGKIIRSFRGHTGLVNSLAFRRDGRSLISGSRDKTVKVWDLSQWSDEVRDR
jgi:WD40 repeat protein/serine/threonine protein kinase